GVACRTALAARGAIRRRRAREKQVATLPAVPVEPAESWSELRPLLDQELCRLPDKYRLPVVLCDLEGRTRQEVARRLQLPEGTLSNRLASARKLLARRLTRRGLTLSAGALATALSPAAAPACVPPPLFITTTRAAALVAAGTKAGAGTIPAAVAA